MLLKDRIVDFAKDFFIKEILQLNPTKFLIAKHFFMDFYFIILLPGAQIFGIVTPVTLGSLMLTDICQMMMVSMSRCTVCYIYAISCPKKLNLSILMLEFPKIAPATCRLGGRLGGSPYQVCGQ
jgi:hypothetical protein